MRKEFVNVDRLSIKDLEGKGENLWANFGKHFLSLGMR